MLTLKTPNSALLVQLTLTMFGIAEPDGHEGRQRRRAELRRQQVRAGRPRAPWSAPGRSSSGRVSKITSRCEERGLLDESARGPYLDAVTFHPISDPTAMLNALQAGDVDLVQRSPRST